MGYRGKVAEREHARELRAQGLTMPDIAAELGVSKSSVSLWVRDVPFTPGPRVRARRREPNALQRRKAAEVAAHKEWARLQVGSVSERDLLIAGIALYAGEGDKRDGAVALANSDPCMIALFCEWLRRFFDVDESRLRVHLYLHQGLDLSSAIRFWSEVTGVPESQFTKPYRAVPDAGIRHSKHVHGCAKVRYSCSATHRRVIGLIDALLGCGPFRGSSIGGAGHC